MKPKDEPTLAHQMRALADKMPSHADDLRAKAQAFEDASHVFHTTQPPLDSSEGENLIATWRAARKAIKAAINHDDGLPREWRDLCSTDS